MLAKDSFEYLYPYSLYTPNNWPEYHGYLKKHYMCFSYLHMTCTVFSEDELEILDYDISNYIPNNRIEGYFDAIIDKDCIDIQFELIEYDEDAMREFVKRLIARNDKNLEILGIL